MKKTFTLALILLTGLFANAQAQPVKWTIDNSHSQVMFTVSHLVISEVTGNFKSFGGEITASKPDFTDAQVTFTIDVKSVNTESEMRDTHLKSDEFFNAEKYPQMTFKGKSIKKIDDKKYQFTGDLTIRDVTKTVTLDVTYFGTTKDPWGNTKAGFKIKGTVNRLEYGLKWNTMTEAGGAVVGSDVEITCNLELTKAK